MRRPRVKGHVLTQEDFPCGRLVAIHADYDSAERIMEFRVPSISRDRVYGLELDVVSLELACGCEAFQDFREASRMPYRRDSVGTFLEHLARAKGFPMLPLVTRPPRGLCPHSRKVRDFVMRHGWMHLFKQQEECLIQRLQEKEAVA